MRAVLLLVTLMSLNSFAFSQRKAKKIIKRANFIILNQVGGNEGIEYAYNKLKELKTKANANDNLNSTLSDLNSFAGRQLSRLNLTRLDSMERLNILEEYHESLMSSEKDADIEYFLKRLITGGAQCSGYELNATGAYFIGANAGVGALYCYNTVGMGWLTLQFGVGPSAGMTMEGSFTGVAEREYSSIFNTEQAIISAAVVAGLRGQISERSLERAGVTIGLGASVSNTYNALVNSVSVGSNWEYTFSLLGIN